MKLNRRAFLGGAAVVATAAVIPFTAAPALPAEPQRPIRPQDFGAVADDHTDNRNTLNAILAQLRDHGMIA